MMGWSVNTKSKYFLGQPSMCFSSETLDIISIKVNVGQYRDQKVKSQPRPRIACYKYKKIRPMLFKKQTVDVLTISF